MSNARATAPVPLAATAAVARPEDRIVLRLAASATRILRGQGRGPRFVLIRAEETGVTIRCDTLTIPLPPGGFCVVELGDTIHLQVTGPVLVLEIALGSDFQRYKSLHACAHRPVSSHTAGFPLLAYAVAGLEQLLGEDEWCLGGIAGQVLDLVIAALRPIEPESTGDQLLLTKARDFIESHLHAEELDPMLVARAVAVSTRTLNRMFEREGETVAGWIRDRRLLHCSEMLISRDAAHLSVSEIGATWGLPDPAHFSRVFRQRYQQPPSRYRAEHRSRFGAARSSS